MWSIAKQQLEGFLPDDLTYESLTQKIIMVCLKERNLSRKTTGKPGSRENVSDSRQFVAGAEKWL